MKKTISLIFALFISIFMINIVEAKELLTSEKTVEYSSPAEIFIGNILYNGEKYYVLNVNNTNTEVVTLTDNYEVKDKKLFEKLTNATMIKYDNTFILIGIEENNLKVYQLDANLKVINQQDSEIIMSLNSYFRATTKDEKIYVIALENGVFTNTNVYEIDKELKITENKFSSYDAELLKDIFGPDYYFVHNNNAQIENHEWTFSDTARNNEYQAIVGTSANITYDPVTEYDNKAKLIILDKDNKEILNKEYDKYLDFIDVEIIKNNIVLLAIDETKDYLLIYNLVTKEEKEIELTKNYSSLNNPNNNYLYKANNKLFIVVEGNNPADEELLQKFAIYNFDCEIFVTENNNGTVEVINKANPYDEVSLSIKANSGFEIKNINIIDSLGNKIILKDNKFIMPENDVHIAVEYEEVVTNPETMDAIFLVAIMSISVLATSVFLYRKLEWLK